MAGHHPLRHCFDKLKQEGLSGEFVVVFTDGSRYELVGSAGVGNYEAFADFLPTLQHIGQRFNHTQPDGLDPATGGGRPQFLGYDMEKIQPGDDSGFVYLDELPTDHPAYRPAIPIGDKALAPSA